MAPRTERSASSEWGRASEMDSFAIGRPASSESVMLAQPPRRSSVRARCTGHTRCAFRRTVFVVVLAGGLVWADEDPDRRARLEGLRTQIAALERAMADLAGRELGILDELRALDAELQLREKEHASAALRLEAVTEEIGRHDSTIRSLESAQQGRYTYLTFRLREIYKGGAEQLLQRLLAVGDGRDYWT